MGIAYWVRDDYTEKDLDFIFSQIVEDYKEFGVTAIFLREKND